MLKGKEFSDSNDSIITHSTESYIAMTNLGKKLEIGTGERANCIETNCNGGRVNIRYNSLNIEQDTDLDAVF